MIATGSVTPNRRPPTGDDALRRCIDVVGASIGLVVTAPVLVACALAISATSPGSPLFGHERVGRGGRRFKVWKLRSMVRDSGGAAVTQSGDRRVTPVGRFLRRTKLDELPQLWNVLVGDMSFVGPRPEVPHLVERYTAEQRAVLDVRPGITDPASLQYANEEVLLGGVEDVEDHYVRVIMPEKLRINLDYLARRTVFADLAVIARTLHLVSNRLSRVDATSESRSPAQR